MPLNIVDEQRPVLFTELEKDSRDKFFFPPRSMHAGNIADQCRNMCTSASGAGTQLP